MMKKLIGAFMSISIAVSANEFHVAKTGNDANPGTAARPFKTISKGAETAMPGDRITVHEGTYREEVNPPRGGTSDERRIVYRAAPGEAVIIKGSEVVKGWTHVEGDVWKWVTKDPDAFFGAFNPFRTQIYGDWYRHHGRLNHVGQVYLNGHWLTEAKSLEEVMQPAGKTGLWYTNDNQYPKDRYGQSFNLLAIELNGAGADQLTAVEASHQEGMETGSHKGRAYIKAARTGQWLTFDRVDFGTRTTQLTLKCATETFGGRVEFRLDGPTGKLLGECEVDFTGASWAMEWKAFNAEIESLSGIHTLCLVFTDKPAAKPNAKEVVIWAQFKDVDPNKELVELNARETVFYPRQTGINHITVSGFTLEHGSPNWAPPTAEQVGLIGTHWSKGWIIENNTIRYSSCAGITLGKYGDEMDNKAMSAEGYVGTIKRAHTNGWTKANIGSHIVRDNTISYCEQAGIVGSLGAAFSQITGNDVFQCHRRGLFSGAEMAGIKFHAPIDSLIADNHIYDCNRGMWLDWMTQGTRVSQNLFHGNRSEDLWLEVNHGPCVIDNNLFLSATSLTDWSQGSAFVHNLFGGKINVSPQGRVTPYHKEHSTEIAGLDRGYGGDNRFMNNLFVVPNALDVYEGTRFPLVTKGNVFLHDSPQIKIVRTQGGVILETSIFDPKGQPDTSLVTTDDLGETAISKLPYKNFDGQTVVINNDYWGRARATPSPEAGPVQTTETGSIQLKVWPK